MDGAERVSLLIGEIYDAALDPALWPAVLEQTCGFVEGSSCAVSTADTVFRETNLHLSWGHDPHYLELFDTKYVKIFPLIPAAMAYAKVGEVVSAPMLVPHEELTETQFYKEWSEPQGICDVIISVLEKSATTFATVFVLRHKRHGLADDAARQRLKLLTPHYRRAVAIGKVLELRTTTVDMLTDTLDSLAAGIFVVDAKGELIRANVAGKRMLDEGKLLRAPRGRLAAVDARSDAVLREAFAGTDAGDAALGTKAIALPLAESGNERWIAHVLPLTAGTRRQAYTAHRGAAALFVQKAALDRPPALQAIAERYHLTPTELRVLVAVVEIGGVPEIAPVLGIAESTVRTHLLKVFDKTGTRRQADLVKLVAGFASPLG